METGTNDSPRRRIAHTGQDRAVAALVMGMIFLALAVVLWTAAECPAALELQPIAAGLTRPIAITHANDGTNRLFITLQGGQMLIHDGASLLPTPFLDISSLVSCCGERGLLSAAFHPNYLNNGWFYVNHTNLSGHTVIARYKVSADPNVADPKSRAVIMRIRQPFANHNGGQLQFGPDGYLYIGMGDGGKAGDPGDRAQNLQVLLGKMLRIDVDGAFPYTIPSDNPFLGNPLALPEIWALGLRNPWRFSFDRSTGQLFIADVGQDSWEEVNLQPANSFGGENYGWRLMEGKHCFNPTNGCNNGTLKKPIIEYSHAMGCAVTGGYRYRGMQILALFGDYLYADFCSGMIWGARRVAGVGWTSTLLHQGNFRISTFGEDENGEIYFADLLSGTVYRILDLAP
jgi:glucose/arabinose dehydrogenase